MNIPMIVLGAMVVVIGLMILSPRLRGFLKGLLKTHS